MWASLEGCLEDVVFLLSAGVEVNSRGQVRLREPWCLYATALTHSHEHLLISEQLPKSVISLNYNVAFKHSFLICSKGASITKESPCLLFILLTHIGVL